MTVCPCGSGNPLDDCCRPILAGAPAPTAEALMRSRYTAFKLGDFDHLDTTLAPEIRDNFDRFTAEKTASETEWQKLEVRTVTGGGVDDETGTVEFAAHFRRSGQHYVHHELASFRREQGRWLYVEGKINPKPPPRQVDRIGRNDPCPCGSGRKFKKCCGA